MSWKTDLALKRIFNSFKRLKTQIFTQDIEALKSLNEAITDSEKTYVNDNLLYAKLLCYVLNGNLHKNGDMKTAIKVASDIFKQPLANHLDILQRNLNNSIKCRYLESIGVDMYNLKDESNVIDQNKEEMFKKLFSDYSIESVTKSFYNSANDFLKETDNYV